MILLHPGAGTVLPAILELRNVGNGSNGAIGKVRVTVETGESEHRMAAVGSQLAVVSPVAAAITIKNVGATDVAVGML